MSDAPALAHIVFFKLKESSEQNIAELVASCDKYLSDHPGCQYYSAGTLVPDLTRPVNDRDFDVALHVVFASRADHDAYQMAAAHLKFIELNKESWAKVRVFDSYVPVE
jgi:hypothetical protein